MTPFFIGMSGFFSLIFIGPWLSRWAEHNPGRRNKVLAAAAFLGIGFLSAYLMSGMPKSDDCHRFSSRSDDLCY